MKTLLSKTISEKLIKIVFIFFLGFVSNTFLQRSINIFFSNLEKKSILVSYHQRLKTLKTLLKSVVSVLIFIVLFLMIFYEFGFNIHPILTGAGILGLAVSFGAQTLIKDLIAGFFIILENQYNIGDFVKIGDTQGKVYKITLRMTVLKDKQDNLIYIPNSEIKKVIIFKKKD